MKTWFGLLVLVTLSAAAVRTAFSPSIQGSYGAGHDGVMFVALTLGGMLAYAGPALVWWWRRGFRLDRAFGPLALWSVQLSIMVPAVMLDTFYR